MPRRAALAAAATLMFAAIGCRDAGAPSSTPGLYRLASVNGEALPFYGPGLGGIGSARIIQAGVLLIRPAGSFAIGITGSYGGFLEGEVRSSEGSVELGFPDLSEPANAEPDWRYAVVAGDSVAFTLDGFSGDTLRYVFRRAPLERPSVSEGRWVLASTSGGDVAPPFVVHDTTYANGFREVRTILHDTLTFFDGLFVREAGEIRIETYDGSNISSVSSAGWSRVRPYGGRGDRLVVGRFGMTPYETGGDTLQVAGGTLSRAAKWPSRATLRYLRPR